VPPLDVVEPEVERRFRLERAQPPNPLGSKRQREAEAIASERVSLGLGGGHDHFVGQARRVRAVQDEAVPLEHRFSFQQV